MKTVLDRLAQLIMFVARAVILCVMLSACVGTAALLLGFWIGVDPVIVGFFRFIIGGMAGLFLLVWACARVEDLERERK
jgi:hypothetical protein